MDYEAISVTNKLSFYMGCYKEKHAGIDAMFGGMKTTEATKECKKYCGGGILLRRYILYVKKQD